MISDIETLAVAKAKCLNNFLFFTRYFFKARKNQRFVIGDHHKLISDALQKVYSGEIKRLIINIAPRYGKCVSLHSMIMNDKGLKEAKDMRVGDIVYSHENGKLVKRKCLGTELTQKESVLIKMRSGRELECSYDHPMLTTFGYIEAAKLNIGDRIKTICSIVDDSNYEIDDNELIFTSLMIFEGNCSGKTIRFSNTDKCIIDLLFSVCSKLGIEVKQYNCNKKQDFNILGGNNGNAVEILKKYGIYGHLCYTKRLPLDWFALSLRQRLIFIDIMFATDGTVNKKNGCCSITLANKGLIQDIQQILSTIGIIAHISYKHNNCAGAWNLNIGRGQTEKLLKLITFYHKRDAAKLSLNKFNRGNIDTYPRSIIQFEKLTYKTHKPPFRCASGKDITREKFDSLCIHFPQLEKYKNDDFYLDKVESVTSIGVKDLIHLEIEDTHNFIANGMVSHNTELAVKNFIANGLAINPSAKFIHLSYSDDLALDNSEDTKNIVQSAEYQALFPEVQIKKNSDSKKKWYTTAGGGVYATSAAGQVTGFGAGQVDDIDFIAGGGNGLFGGALIIDDPIKPEDADSELQRERINTRYDSTIVNRVNSRNTPIIIIMQRLHERDLCGYLMEEDSDKWHVLSLPCIKDDGSALWEFKHTIEELRKIESRNQIVFERQYLQRPMPIAGRLYKTFNTYDYDNLPIECDELKAVVDTADTGDDYLCSIVYAPCYFGYYIRDVYYTQQGMEITEQGTAKQLSKFQVREARIESNNGGRGFARNVERLCRELNNYTTSITWFHQKDNKDVRIFTKAADVQNMIYYPSDWETRWAAFAKHIKGYMAMGKNLHDDAEDAITLIVESETENSRGGIGR